MAPARFGGKGGTETRAFLSRGFGLVEDGFYVLVAGTLSIAGVILFGYSIYSFVSNVADLSLSDNILELLDNLLLVFIFTELIHTVRTVINEKVLIAEPFLIVGIVAGIRRLVVLSAEVKDLIGTKEFSDAMLELSILSGGIILLTLAVFLLRHTTHSEPRSAHEPGEDDKGAEEETRQDAK
jgi:uncharacterized membrane protein (DUF373 family)